MHVALHPKALDSRFAVLALLQVVFAGEIIAYSLWTSSTASMGTLDALLGLVLAVLAAVSLLLLPRFPAQALDAAIVSTWLIIAFVVGTRPSSEGELIMALSVLLMAIYVSYCRPRRLAVAHLIGMTVAILGAVLMGGLESSFFLVVWVVIAVAVTGWVVITLRDRDRHLRLLMENSADMVFQTRDGIFQWVSPSSAEVLGWNWWELIGMRKLDLWHPDDRPRAKMLRELTIEGTSSRETMRLRQPSGQYIWVEATLRPYLDAYGYPGISGSMRNVTDRVIAQDALADSEREQRQLAERLAEAGQMQSRLIQNMTHEFRTPLTVMRAPLQRLARQDGQLGPTERLELEAALRASRRLAGLVDDLLEVAQSGSGAAVTIREPVDVGVITSQAVEPFRQTCESAGLGLVFENRQVPSPLWLDENAWTSIVTNLVSNAVRFTREGEIHVAIEYDPPWLCLEVVDTGVGIAPAELESMFGRFTQGSTPPVRGSSGTGIGLAAVRELAADLGGTSRLDRIDAGGTSATVRVRAPRSAPGTETLEMGDQ